MTWLTGWTHRKSKTIDGSTAGIQTNYQMKLVVHKGTSPDIPTDIYIANVRSDFGDVRFTSSDGTSLLNYWLDPTTLISDTSATFWIKVDSIPAAPSSTNIYIYYDNPIQTTTSNRINTFDYFEDFSTNPTSSWPFTNLFNSPSYTVNGYMGINYTQDWNRGGYFRHNTLNLGNNREYSIKMNFYYRDNIPPDNYEWIEWDFRFDTVGNNYYLLMMRHLSALVLQRVDSGSAIGLGSTSYPFTFNHYYDVKVAFDGIRIKLYMDGALIFDVPDDGKIYSGTMQTYVNRAAGLWDDISVRKLVSPEPAFSTTGPQEPIIFDILTLAGD